MVPVSTFYSRSLRAAARGFTCYDGSVPYTIGYHVVKSGYGLWLPGDERGSWSETWDANIGFIKPHTLHDGDPVRLRMAKERMKHPPVQLNDEMIDAVTSALELCVDKSNGGLSITAVTIQPTHMHLLIPYAGRDIHHTMRWIADQTTKAVHSSTEHTGPVWRKGKWCTYVFDQSHWNNAMQYIQKHHPAPQPYLFVTPL